MTIKRAGARCARRPSFSLLRHRASVDIRVGMWKSRWAALAFGSVGAVLWLGAARADNPPGVAVAAVVQGAPLAFPSSIELDPKLGLTLRVTPPLGVKISAELIESPGTKPASLALVANSGSPTLVAPLPLMARFTSGHIHFVVRRDGFDENQYRQFAIRPSARAKLSALQSQDGQATLYLRSERLDPEAEVILADVGALDAPLPEGSVPVVGPLAIVTTRPGKNDNALGAFLFINLAPGAAEKRKVRVLRLDAHEHRWLALDARTDPARSVQAAVDTFGTFVVVSP